MIMKVSGLISALQNLMEKHGDRDVCIDCDCEIHEEYSLSFEDFADFDEEDVKEYQYIRIKTK